MGNKNTEYWKSGTSEEWFFRKEELPNLPLFQHSPGFQRSRWCSFLMQRSMTTFNPAFSAFVPASL